MPLYKGVIQIIRYIIRPNHILGTPRRLKEALGAKRTITHPSRFNRPSLLKDFFLSYPPIETLEEYSHECDIRNFNPHQLGDLGEYLQLGRKEPINKELSRRLLGIYRISRQFTTSSKASQRAILRSNLGGSFPTPLTTEIPGELRGDCFIVRPLHHSQGKGWRLTSNPSDFIQGSEYIQELYPKDYEYRILCVRGEPLVTLLKKVPEEMPKDQPWNHSNGSTFVTIRDISRCRLSNTDVYDRIRQSPLLKCLDLAGIDIMYKNKDYQVAEVNVCPSLQIPESLEKISKFINEEL